MSLATSRLATAARAREVVRFDYSSTGSDRRAGAANGERPPRRVEPHHGVTRGWALVVPTATGPEPNSSMPPGRCRFTRCPDPPTETTSGTVVWSGGQVPDAHHPESGLRSRPWTC